MHCLKERNLRLFEDLTPHSLSDSGTAIFVLPLSLLLDENLVQAVQAYCGSACVLFEHVSVSDTTEPDTHQAIPCFFFTKA